MLQASPSFPIADPILLQRLEGVAAALAGVVAYAWLGQSWLIFALLLLAPDLFMLGYLRSPRFGALNYNLGHTYIAPALLAVSGLVAGPLAYGLAAIWLAHIGGDRALGYGLKRNGFDQTHLGPTGRARRSSRSVQALSTR